MVKGKVNKRPARRRRDEGELDDDELDLQNEQLEELQKLVEEARANRPQDKKTKKRKQKQENEDEDESEEGNDDEDVEDEEDDELSDEERVLRELKAEADGEDAEDEDEGEDEDGNGVEGTKNTRSHANKKKADKLYSNDAAMLRQLAAELRIDNFAESLVVSDATVYEEKLNPEDDKLREARFQDIAKRAVKSGRDKLDELKVPHRRPTDFMAEMIKSDDHMARVKRRLIFEQQKMKVVESRKAAERNKKRVKEIKKQKDQEKLSKKREASQIAASYRAKGDADDDGARKKPRVHGKGDSKGAKNRPGKQKRKSIRGTRGKH